MIHPITLSPKSDIDGFEKDWKAEPNSRGEGFVLGKEGHFFVLKEKRPRRVVEFGPKGSESVGFASVREGAFALPFGDTSEFVPIQEWKLGDQEENVLLDLSDIFTTPGRPPAVFRVWPANLRRIWRLEATNADEMRLQRPSKPNSGYRFPAPPPLMHATA